MFSNSSIPTLSLVLTAVSICFSILVPVVLLVFCRVRYGKGLKAAAVGALCFFVGAMVLESLLHSLVFSLFPALALIPAAYVIYGCLAAGLFEETSRLIGLKLLCRKDPSFATGLGYGIGHGGFESAAMVGLSLAANLYVMILLNGGTDPASLGLTEAQVQALAAAAPTSFLWAGIERLFSMGLHIALSLLIWMVATKQLPGWFYWVSVGLHALANVGAALYQCGVWTNLAGVELWTLAFALMAAVLVRVLYRKKAMQ